MSRPDFDAQASHFDQRAGLPTHVCQGVARAVSEIAGDGVIVEVGAGTGEIGLEIAKLREGYIGFDLSPAMLDRFRARLGDVRAELIVADGNERWPVEDGSCRAVFGSRSLHLLRLEHLLAEIARVRSPAGLAVLAGRVVREGESVRARMRREMRHLLREAGHEGRSASESTARLIGECEARGGRALGPRVVARWSVRAAPADSLRSWEGQNGLAGTPVDAGIKSEILERLRAWATAEFGDLECPVEATEEYMLHGATFPGAAGTTR
jgi:ubiquinone/menaquinone biosynthesis C-methylase UbiE